MTRHAPPPVRPLRLAVLLVAHNRREKTLRAVRSLAAATQIETTPVLFDDASTDGTADAVRAERPDSVVVTGDGSAFWNGGLYRCWSRALDLPVDGFLWLNDDVELDPDALSRLAEEWRARLAAGEEACILVGATRDPGGHQSYGGMYAQRRPTALRLQAAAARDRVTPIDTFNGNIVLVTRAVVDRIGINDPVYFHNLGDVDYGLRASAAGIGVYALPGTLGECESNHEKSSRGYGSKALSWREQWRKVNTHHGLPPRSWLQFTRRHGGVWWPVHFLLPYRHLLKVWRR